MTRGLVWKALLALSLGANVALGTVLVLRETAPGAVETPAASGSSVPCLLASLGLDSSRQARVDAVRAEFLAAHDARHEEVKAARERLFSAIERSAGERTEVDAGLSELTEAQMAMRRGLVDYILGILAVLEPGERTRFLEGIRARFVEGPRHGGLHPAEESCGPATTATEAKAP